MELQGWSDANYKYTIYKSSNKAIKQSSIF